MKNTVYGLVTDDLDIDILKNLCVSGGIQTGPFGSQLHQKDYLTIGTPIITVEHLGENRVLHQDLPHVSDVDKERLSRYVMQKGDIIFSRVGSVDRRALVRDEEDGWLFSGRCLRVRPDNTKIDSDYLSWFFGIEIFKDYIRRIAVGATMPSLNTELLSNVPIIFPPLPEQRAIAEVLGALDDKIELNRRMNRTLEEMARAVFRKLMKDAGGRMKVKKLGDICEFAYGKGLREDERQTGSIPVYGSSGQIGWHNKCLVKGPGIIVGRKGNPGIVTWSQNDFFPIDTTFYVLPNKPKTSLYWLYFTLTSLSLANLSADSAVPGLNRNIAYMSDVNCPSEELMNRFDAFVIPVSNKIAANEKEIRTLAQLRDTLLPKLMKGEVRVKDV